MIDTLKSISSLSRFIKSVRPEEDSAIALSYRESPLNGGDITSPERDDTSCAVVPI